MNVVIVLSSNNDYANSLNVNATVYNYPPGTPISGINTSGEGVLLGKQIAGKLYIVAQISGQPNSSYINGLIRSVISKISTGDGYDQVNIAAFDPGGDGLVKLQEGGGSGLPGSAGIFANLLPRLGWLVAAGLGAYKTVDAKNKAGWAALTGVSLLNLSASSAGIGKITDAGKIAPGGRSDRAKRRGIDVRSKTGRPPRDITEAHTDPEVTIKRFGLKSIEWGNWVTETERREFLIALTESLYDLAKLLRIPPSKLGLNKLHIAIGARGKGGFNAAAAHYEPSTNAINLTKEWGKGALAHEYGHFLDYHLQGKFRLAEAPSGGRSVRMSVNYDILEGKSGRIRQTMEQLFKLMYFRNGTTTAFFKNVAKMPDYWRRRTEVFARTFEAYVDYLNSNNVVDGKSRKNYYLQANVQDVPYYPTKQQIEESIIFIDQIVYDAFS